MFEKGSLIYFTPFRFRDGRPAKDKFFLILKVFDESLIIAGLPSSQNYIPTSLQKEIGCLKNENIDLGCYVFDSKEIVGENGFYFPKKTIVYGQYLDIFDQKTIISSYPIQSVDYTLVDKLKKEIVEELVACFLTATNVKRKIKRALVT